MKYIILSFIKVYQYTLSYDHGLIGKIFPYTRNCRFTPSCSQYSYESIKKYGVIKGIKMSIDRLSRCNRSTTMGTYDPVK